MEYVKVKNPDVIIGLMTDQETIKSLQNDLMTARDEISIHKASLAIAQEKNHKYDDMVGHYKKLVIDVINQANEGLEIDYSEAIDLDELEEKINRRFDINEHQNDIDSMIKDYMTYDPDFNKIVSKKVNEALQNCRIVVGGE
tara:strand:+ start:98 stop:523 length:426 start_codon:yes stop_codon:yes gene_type:complete